MIPSPKIDEMVARLRAAIGEQPSDLQQYRERIEAFSQIRAEEEKKLDEILNEGQQRRLYEIRLQGEGVGALLRGDFASELGLSDEQKEELQALVRAQREQIQRDAPPRSAAARAYFHEQFEQQLIAVLSEDQKKKWEDLKGEPFTMFDRRRQSRR
jgi:ATP-dependent Clp protease ATP-binding subunit ClpA